MTGPEDLAAAEDRDRRRAARADREYVIDTLKTAFVHGRLTRDELDARAGQALATRTYAELAALIADIPAVAGLARPPAPAGRWLLARAAARPRWRRRLLAAAVIAVAAGAAIAAPRILPGTGGGPLATAAWAIQRNPDGTIKVIFKQTRDAAGLQAALKAHGVDAYVRYAPWVSKPSGPVSAHPAERCGPAASYPSVPVKVVAAVFPFRTLSVSGRGYAETINPAAIPPGDAILIQVTWIPARPGLGIEVEDTILGDHRSPVCTPDG